MLKPPLSTPVADRLDALVPEFDQLIADARRIRDARHYDELEGAATAIARALVAAFRRRR